LVDAINFLERQISEMTYYSTSQSTMVYYTMVKIPWYFAGVYLDTIFTMVLQWYIAPKYHCNFFLPRMCRLRH